MKKTFISIIVCLLALTGMQAATSTIYTKVTGTPKNGWAGTYIIVYELSDTKAYVWNGEDNSGNYKIETIADGKITSENLKDYHITVSKEGSNKYYVKAKDGYIGSEAKKNTLTFSNGGKECTITANGSYTILETNTNTCRFLYNTNSGTNRFRFYYDKDKKWQDTDLKNVCFYALGEIEMEEPKNQLDINYAQADLYANGSKFPTNGDQFNQYFYTNLRLAQKESESAVPFVDLEIYAPTQYSIAGSYKSDQVSNPNSSTNLSYWINCQAGSKHSTFIFPSKEGGTQAAINLATMTITKVGKSQHENAYVYHIKLVLTDSNKKIWTLDKDLDVYAQWIDRDKNTGYDMTPQPFELESGNHGVQTDLITVSDERLESGGEKIIQDGQLFIRYGERMYNIMGQEVQQ